MKRITILFLSTGLALALACGDNDDGGGGGDGPDASDVDGGPVSQTGTCGLVVGDDGVGGPGARGDIDNVAGVPVFFHGPDGSLNGFDITNVKGEASSDACVTDTMVTFILDAESDNPQLVTYTHVGHEDTVYYRYSPEGVPAPPTYANVTITGAEDVSLFPEILPDGEATMWFDFSRNNAESGSWTPAGPTEPFFGEDIPRYLLGADQATLSVLSRLDIPGPTEDHGYAFLKGFPITEGTMEVPTDHDMVLPAWTRGSLDNANLITNAPHDTDYINGTFDARLNGLSRINSNSIGWSESGVVPPVLSNTIRGLPDGYADFSLATSHLTYNSFGNSVWEREASMSNQGPFQRTVTVDWMNRLPRMQSMLVSDVFSNQPSFSWQSDDALEGNLGVFQVRFYVRDLSGGTSYHEVDWLVVTPNVGAGQFTVPRLSDEYLPIIEDRILDAVALGGVVFDVPHLDYIEVPMQEPFDPFDLFYPNFSWNMQNYVYSFPAPADSTDIRRTAVYNEDWYD